MKKQQEHNQNRLHPDNCNKAQCKTCIFRTDGNQLVLSEGRMEEIVGYLSSLKSSHVCHVTNKTCYGGLKVMAQSMFEQGIIPTNDVEIMLRIAQAVLRM